VRASGKNHEQTPRLNHHPDAIRLQKLLVDPRLETGREAYVDDGVWLVKGLGKKKRKNIKKLTPRYPQMHAQMSRRRSLLISMGAAADFSGLFFTSGVPGVT
jgi:hypothetical protein